MNEKERQWKKYLWVLIPIIVLWFVFAPPRWWLNLTKSVDLTDPVATGQALVEKYECRSCHKIGGAGALKAPDLNGVTERLDEVAIRLWLRNPRAVKGNTPMPNFHLSDSEIEALVAYLTALDEAAAQKE
ncbi:MAG: cytochrome c [Chloroflexi bacterium]|nr:MAG: cytochrome c [Chloroflexota bacterium]